MSGTRGRWPTGSVLAGTRMPGLVSEPGPPALPAAA
jgi:hypothetical protein